MPSFPLALLSKEILSLFPQEFHYPSLPDTTWESQNNLVDCGVHVCLFAFEFIYGESPTFKGSSRENRDILKQALISKKLPFEDFHMDASTSTFGYMPASPAPLALSGLTGSATPATPATSTELAASAKPQVSQAVEEEQKPQNLGERRGRRETSMRTPPGTVATDAKGKTKAVDEEPDRGAPSRKRMKTGGSLSPSKAFRGAGAEEDDDQVKETKVWGTLSTKVQEMIEQGKCQQVLSLLLTTKWQHCKELVKAVTRCPHSK